MLARSPCKSVLCCQVGAATLSSRYVAKPMHVCDSEEMLKLSVVANMKYSIISCCDNLRPKGTGVYLGRLVSIMLNHSYCSEVTQSQRVRAWQRSVTREVEPAAD
jgi:hypothetical protein